MSWLLAYADNSDPTQANFICILICAAGTLVVGALAGVIIVSTRRRAHPHAQLINTATIFWGIITLGSIVNATVTQLAFAKQYSQDLLSGYGNPQEVGPELPWVLWGTLAAVYAGLLGWTIRKKS